MCHSESLTFYKQEQRAISVPLKDATGWNLYSTTKLRLKCHGSLQILYNYCAMPEILYSIDLYTN